MGLTDIEREALVKYRVDKSNEVFKEATDVAQMGHWNLTVNRLYYAVFHVCNAYLLSKGQVAKTHAGVLRLIMLELVKTNILSDDDGTLISTLFNMRNTGDYDDLFDWNDKQVYPLIKPTELLLKKIQKIIN